MTRADRKNAFKVSTTDFAAAGRPSARNYEALSKTRYNSVRISNLDLKFFYSIFSIYCTFEFSKNKFRFFQPKLPDYYLKKSEDQKRAKKPYTGI